MTQPLTHPDFASIRVAVVDCQPVVRAGVRVAIETDDALSFIGEAASGREARSLAQSSDIDVVVVDTVMLEARVSNLFRSLSDQGLRIVVFTSQCRAFHAERYRYIGASALVPKTKSLATLLEVVREVTEGEGRWYVDSSGDIDASQLTDREFHIWRLAARGMSNGAIASALGLSECTVRNYMSRIYDKLGVDSWREATAAAWAYGATGNAWSEP